MTAETSGDSDSGTVCVSDDPRRGARLKDTERKETKSGPSDTSPTEKATSDNMSNDPRIAANTIRKDGEQPDKTINRKDGSVDDNMISDDKMSYDPCTPADAIKKDRKQTEKV